MREARLIVHGSSQLGIRVGQRLPAQATGAFARLPCRASGCDPAETHWRRGLSIEFTAPEMAPWTLLTRVFLVSTTLCTQPGTLLWRTESTSVTESSSAAPARPPQERERNGCRRSSLCLVLSASPVVCRHLDFQSVENLSAISEETHPFREPLSGRRAWCRHARCACMTAL